MSGGDSGAMAATIPLVLNSRSFLLSAACSLTTSLGWPIIPRTVYISLLAPFTLLLFMIVKLPVLVAGMVLGCETEGRTTVCEWDFSRGACPASNASLKTPASCSPCTITWKRRNPFLNCHHLSEALSHEAKSSKPGVIANNLGRSCSIKLVRKPYNEVHAKESKTPLPVEHRCVSRDHFSSASSSAPCLSIQHAPCTCKFQVHAISCHFDSPVTKWESRWEGKSMKCDKFGAEHKLRERYTTSASSLPVKLLKQ